MILNVQTEQDLGVRTHGLLCMSQIFVIFAVIVDIEY